MIDKITERLDKLYYEIKIGKNTWKRHVDQVANKDSNVHLTNDTDFEVGDKNISFSISASAINYRTFSFSVKIWTSSIQI